jgi:hypothetical protein
MAHKPSEQIVRDIEFVSTQIEIGAKYAHYKDRSKIYSVIGFGVLEATDDVCVIYRAEYEPELTFIRPAYQWSEEVQCFESIVSRFTKIQNQ